MSEIAKHWIDGEWTTSDTASESVNPATGAVLGQWADGGQTEARVKVADGKVTYLQFLEDSYATAASFRKDGSWTVQTEPGAEPFQVRL
jgi:hypothetical protein